MKRQPDPELVATSSDDGTLSTSAELPVVARLVVEIRSDGTRTIARGGLEDLVQGQRVAIEAEGGSPMQLAYSLAKSMFAVPSLARRTVRALLPGRSARKGQRK